MYTEAYNIRAIGSCTTSYVDNVPRAINVELAAQRINGIVVQPGGNFSFFRYAYRVTNNCSDRRETMLNQEKTGKFIAEMRKEHNLTQKQLAEALGVTDKAISKWECGRSIRRLKPYVDLWHWQQPCF